MNKLFDHQIEAIKKMKNGCILCGSVGSGKSITSIAYYYICNGGKIEGVNSIRTVAPKEFKHLYIITTARKRDTKEWIADISKLNLFGQIEDYVTIDSWNNIGKYEKVSDSFFIFDEQRVVGSGTWVKKFLKIVKSNEWILLSATPGDTWSDYIPVFIANGFYKTFGEFRREHVVYKPFTNFPQIDRYINTGRLNRYRRDILVMMDCERKTVEHHADIYVEYDSSKYKEICKTRWDFYNDRPIENASQFCYLLRRVCNEDMSRIRAVMEVLTHFDRVIIFYNFDYELDMLKKYMKELAPMYTIGEWNGHRHLPIPDNKQWLYLVQYTAGAEGWNCTECNVIIFFSQNYSYKTLIQAAGRINRINTKFTDLYYYHLKSRAGIDVAISRVINEKGTFNERIFAGF